MKLVISHILVLFLGAYLHQADHDWEKAQELKFCLDESGSGKLTPYCKNVLNCSK